SYTCEQYEKLLKQRSSLQSRHVHFYVSADWQCAKLIVNFLRLTTQKTWAPTKACAGHRHSTKTSCKKMTEFMKHEGTGKTQHEIGYTNVHCGLTRIKGLRNWVVVLGGGTKDLFPIGFSLSAYY